MPSSVQSAIKRSRALHIVTDEDALFEEWLLKARVETMECRVASRHRLPMITDEDKTRVRRKQGVTLVQQNCEWCGCLVTYKTDAEGIVSNRRSGYSDYAEDYLMQPGSGRFTKERRQVVRKVLEELALDRAKAARQTSRNAAVAARRQRDAG